jgi:Fe-S-cluster-containing hydrogenase component 2
MVKIDREKCIGCGVCVNICPVGAISMNNGKAEINGNKCIDCGRCIQACPQRAVSMEKKIPVSGQEQRTYGVGFNLPNWQGNSGIVMPGTGRGLGRGRGRGLRKGPRDGRGGGRGGR